MKPLGALTFTQAYCCETPFGIFLWLRLSGKAGSILTRAQNAGIQKSRLHLISSMVFFGASLLASTKKPSTIQSSVATAEFWLKWVSFSFFLTTFQMVNGDTPFFFGLEGFWGQPQWPNFPSPWATMLALRLDCSTAALPTPQKVLPIWELVKLTTSVIVPGDTP